MMFTLTIECDNVAFANDPGDEIGRILQKLAATVEIEGAYPGNSWALRDVNGNTVGTAEFTSSPAPSGGAR